MMDFTPWDGQYTFTHHIMRQSVREVNKTLGANPFWTEEKEVHWWKFILDNYANECVM